MSERANSHVKIIKATNGQTKAFKAIDFQSEAAMLLEQARRNADLLEQQAYRAGFAKGEEAGIKMGLSRIQPLFETFKALIASLDNAKEQYLQCCEPEIIRLALEIAKKVMRVVVHESDQVVIHAVRDVMDAAIDKGDIKMRLNPEDKSIVESLQSELLSVEGVDSLDFEGDPNVPKGGVRLVMDTGFVESDPESSLKKIEEALS